MLVCLIILQLTKAGKTTILQHLKLGESQKTVPTIGFSVETFKVHNVTFTCWDLGGQLRIRSMWRFYYNKAGSIIWVIDSSDRNPRRIETAKEELTKVLSSPELSNVPVLVFANKQDLPNAMSIGEVEQGLGLSETGHRYFIQGCCGLNGNGLLRGLEWLSTEVRSGKN